MASKGKTNKQTNKNKLTNEWTNDWTNEWINKWINKYIHTSTDIQNRLYKVWKGLLYRVTACFNFLYIFAGPTKPGPFWHSLERGLGSITSNDFKFAYSLRPRQHVQVHSLAWADLWPDEITYTCTCITFQSFLPTYCSCSSLTYLDSWSGYVRLYKATHAQTL